MCRILFCLLLATAISTTVFAEFDEFPEEDNLSASQSRSIGAVPSFPKGTQNFKDEDVICFHGDLREYHPECRCCGKWTSTSTGVMCVDLHDTNCSKEYKMSHYRTAYWAKRGDPRTENLLSSLASAVFDE